MIHNELLNNLRYIYKYQKHYSNMSIKNIFKHYSYFHPFSNQSAKVCPKCGCLLKLVPQIGNKNKIYQCPICGRINSKLHFSITDFP